MIRRLLIANRGEIAIRIAAAARTLGIVPVGVYSDADEDALFRRALDASVRIGPAPAGESYLDASAIVAAAQALGADAIHPGYGFLSEQSAFAQATLDAGLIFVGPPPRVLALAGSKSSAKRIARAAGVPVLPGYDDDDQSGDVLRDAAVALGVPLAIKATAGGGGRGLRIVHGLEHFEAALGAARREARAAFGDDRVLLERYVERPRHLEIQILADAHGNVVHLGERECSIQRRHQKLIEEAPSAALDAALRARLCAAAAAVARALGYVNAGTVEFVLAPDGTFAFLEVNARLQVEHAVTECVWGIDLVAEQLRIAAGERLRWSQAELAPHGWSIEGRLVAEDPSRDFAPQTGALTHFVPPSGPGVRTDAGVAAGSTVSVYYDSLLAKIVVYGDDRAAAVRALRVALDATVVAGIATNLGLLRAVAASPAFVAARTTTAFLDDHAGALRAAVAEDDEAALLLAIAGLLEVGSGWRSAGIGVPLALVAGARTVVLRADRIAHGWRLHGDRELTLTIEDRGPSELRVRAGERCVVGSARLDGAAVFVSVGGARSVFALRAPPRASAGSDAAAHGADGVVAPMPGKIVDVLVAAGSTVAAHQLLVVLEAMKIEHRIEAPSAGLVTVVHVAPGDLVAAGATLLNLDGL